MPFYSVEHSFPLTLHQKSQLATAITKLHSSKFLTPSVFVHVNFKSSDATDQNYFVAGTPRTDSTNRIVGLVRTSESRTQEHWQELAHDIEEAWYDAVNGEIIEGGKNEGKRKNALSDTQNVIEAKKIRLVTFYPMIAVRENGDAIPQVSDCLSL